MDNIHSRGHTGRSICSREEKAKEKEMVKVPRDNLPTFYPLKCVYILACKAIFISPMIHSLSLPLSFSVMRITFYNESSFFLWISSFSSDGTINCSSRKEREREREKHPHPHAHTHKTVIASSISLCVYMWKLMVMPASITLAVIVLSGKTWV